MAGAPILEVREVTKRFPGVVALRGVNMTLHRGEVLAVIGENGAGKSTLMKILAGIEAPDRGEIRIDGSPAAIDSVQAALRCGIALIHQELNLCDNLSVGANLFLGREPNRRGLLDRRSIDRQARQVLAMVGLDLDPRVVVRQLSIGHQQMVEIAKALSVQARILIMDEPTSSLSQRETDALFGVVRDLRQRGVSVVYISHRLGEVGELADRVLVLRDGQNAGELAKSEIDHDRMVKLMVGRNITPAGDHSPGPTGPPVLEVENLVVPGRPRHRVSLSIRRGEIVGLAGLVGAGRSELLRVLFGIDRPIAGSIRIGGQPVRLAHPRDAIRAGIGLVPEDRKCQGLVLEMAVRENIGLAGLFRHRRWAGFVNGRRQRSDAANMIARLGIRSAGDRQVVQSLSGGNQQKVVLAKWLALEPRALLLDEPTRGIDVGSKGEIYRIMHELAAAGVAILFVSSEMEEILRMADRVLVMHEGGLAGQLTRGELSEESVMYLATGGRTAARRLAELAAPPSRAE